MGRAKLYIYFSTNVIIKMLAVVIMTGKAYASVVPVNIYTGKALQIRKVKMNAKGPLVTLGTLVTIFKDRLYSLRYSLLGARQKLIVPNEATLYRKINGYCVRKSSSQLELKFVDFTNKFKYRRENRPSKMKSPSN